MQGFSTDQWNDDEITVDIDNIGSINISRANTEVKISVFPLFIVDNPIAELAIPFQEFLWNDLDQLRHDKEQVETENKRLKDEVAFLRSHFSDIHNAIKGVANE